MSILEQALGNIGVGQGNLNLAKEQIKQMVTQGKDYPMLDGSRPWVICGGIVEQAKDLADAQRIAEERTLQRNADAYVLKPVTRVALKRDVVTTKLPDGVSAVPSVLLARKSQGGKRKRRKKV